MTLENVVLLLIVHVLSLKLYMLHIQFVCQNIFAACTKAFEVFLLFTISRDVHTYQHLNSLRH